MKIPYFLVFLISRVRSQEVSTPSSLLRPRDHNHHPFDAEQFLKNLRADPTKQGPVLFPNDGPQPPRPPLIVTSRPLLESIARSELGQNNTVTSQSQVNGRVSFLPYLARVQEYRPYVPAPTFKYNFVPTQIPYAEVVKKSRLNSLGGDNRYNDYEEQSVLPPVYKALSDHAQQKVLKLKEKKRNYNNNYLAPTQNLVQNYQNNGINEENSEYDQNQNYAFSYRVNDQKTGDDFSHSQQSSGSATNGEYRVRLPDGRMQIVSYTADENGYKADVRYDEETGGNRIDNQKDYNDYTHNDYVDRNNAFSVNNNAYEDGNNNVYVDRKNNDIIDRSNVYVLNNVDYTDRNNKHNYDIEKKETTSVNERDDYYYPDVSKEYNDYSTEYNNHFEPHKSKFTFANNIDLNNNGIASTVKPSYEELKDLFVTKNIYNTQQNYDSVELNVPSSSPIPYEGTTEHVVLIGNKTPNLYTDTKHSIPRDVPNYETPRVVVASTPRSYLVSTIASLKNKVHLANKPILTDRFIDKINKYLSFN